MTSSIVLAGATIRRDRPYLPGGHAMRVGAGRDPLLPLRYGFASLELAVRLHAGGLWLDQPEHAGPFTVRVLDPLAARVARAGGRIYPGQPEPVWLLVELAEAEPGRAEYAYQLLDQQLRARREVFSRYANGRLYPGPVTLLLTGPSGTRHLLSGQRERYAFCDGTLADVGSSAAPPSLVPVVGERWGERFGWDGRHCWDGRAAVPVEERYLLRGLVRAAHADGRRIRVYGVPERPRRVRRGYWRELAAAGVDLIGGTDLAALRRFLIASGRTGAGPGTDRR